MMDFPVTFFLFRCGSWAGTSKRIELSPFRFHDTKIVRARFNPSCFPKPCPFHRDCSFQSSIYIHISLPTMYICMYFVPLPSPC